MLERDMGNIDWTQFRTLCQQRFGLTIDINNLLDLGWLPFCSTVKDYKDASLVRMDHADYLSLAQQV